MDKKPQVKPAYERTSLEAAFEAAQARSARQREADHSGRAERVTSVERDIARLAGIPIQETTAEEDSETHVTDTPTIQTTTGHSENTPVNHPVHYNADPSGVECIQIIRHRNHNIGAAIKYLWRAGLKVLGTKSAREAEIQDLEKAVWYIQDEIARLKALP